MERQLLARSGRPLKDRRPKCAKYRKCAVFDHLVGGTRSLTCATEDPMRRPGRRMSRITEKWTTVRRRAVSSKRTYPYDPSPNSVSRAPGRSRRVALILKREQTSQCGP